MAIVFLICNKKKRGVYISWLVIHDYPTVIQHLYTYKDTPKIGNKKKKIRKREKRRIG